MFNDHLAKGLNDVWHDAIFLNKFGRAKSKINIEIINFQRIKKI